MGRNTIMVLNKGVMTMRPCLNITTSESITELVDTKHSNDDNIYINNTLLNIQKDYKIEKVDTVRDMYRTFKSYFDSQPTTELEPRRVQHALDNTRTYFRIKKEIKDLPEPTHDASHEDYWRE